MPDANTYTTMLPVAAGALLAAALRLGLLRFATRAIDRFAARHEHEGLLEEAAAFAKRLTRFVRSTLWFIALLVAGLVMLRGIGVRGTPRVSAEEIVAWLVGPGLRLSSLPTSAYLVARGIALPDRQPADLSRLARRAARPTCSSARSALQTLGQLLRVVATLLVVGVATLMALSLFNVDIRPILTGAGIAGLAVGFGAQNLVRDVIAGFFLILEDQVRLGDVVSINGKSGLVEAIRLRTIALRGQDGTVHVIPNGVITELSNMTKDFSYAVLDVGIPYEENVDTVEDVLRVGGARAAHRSGARAEYPGAARGARRRGLRRVVGAAESSHQDRADSAVERRRVSSGAESSSPSRRAGSNSPTASHRAPQRQPAIERATTICPPSRKPEWTTPSSSRVRTAESRSTSTSSPTCAARSSRTARSAATRGASASIAAMVSGTSISSERTVPSRIAR